MSAGKLVVLSGPSGVGKNTICDKLVEHDRIEHSVSATTRSPRSGEVEGEAYFFLTREQFERDVTAGRFLEHAAVLGHRYGTPREAVERSIAARRLCLLNIDVAGAMQIKDSGMAATFIFLMPPDLAELERRITGRASETPEQVQQRLALARREIEQRQEYDHMVVNDEVERAVKEILQILGVT